MDKMFYDKIDFIFESCSPVHRVEVAQHLEQENIFKLINLKTKKHWIYKFSCFKNDEEGECYEINIKHNRNKNGDTPKTKRIKNNVKRKENENYLQIF